MSDQPPSPPDLANLEMDLAKSFQPAWVKESAAPERLSRMVEKHGGDDASARPERPGNRRDRGPGRDRPPARRDGPKRRDDRQDGPRQPHRPEREVRPPAELEGWTVQFLPDRRGVENLARQIKAGAKAYPLFGLARLVLEKSERYLVEFQRASERGPALFQLRADGSVWLTEAAAIAHALARHLDKFYRRERVTTEPPKGSFTSIAVCGLSGELLGPSNHHDYPNKLRLLHAKRYTTMPFDVYKSRVRMERDEALIAKWKEDQSTTDEYYPVGDEPPVVTEIPAAVETPEPAEASAVAEASGSAEIPVAAETAPALEATETPEPSPEAPAPTEAAAGPAALKLATLAEVERHFREHHAAAEIVPIKDRVKVPGPAAMNESSPPAHFLARRVWDELQRFPLPLAHIIGQQLTSQGLQMFKTSENITCVSIARPRHLDRAATPVSEALSAMLEYLEKHPAQPRAEQWKGLVALRPLSAEGAEARRDSAVASDLAWLLHEGHVIDYAGRNLEAARRPQTRPATPRKADQPKPDPTPEKTSAE